MDISTRFCYFPDRNGSLPCGRRAKPRSSEHHPYWRVKQDGLSCLSQRSFQLALGSRPEVGTSGLAFDFAGVFIRAQSVGALRRRRKFSTRRLTTHSHRPAL